MNKTELINQLHDKTGITKTRLEELHDLMFETIVKALARDENVTVAGFGVFAVESRAARDARNPRTGEPIRIPARKAVKFKVGKRLKEAVNR